MQRKPTRVQKVMALLLGGAFLLMAIFLFPEIAGIISSEAEDTFSELVWDLPGWAVGVITFFSVLAGVILVWTGPHYIEGWLRRRDEKKDDDA